MRRDRLGGDGERPRRGRVGSRGDDRPDSDIDVVVRLTDEARSGGFSYFGRLDRLRGKLEAILARHVDLVAEPVEKERLRREIEKDRVLAF